MYIILFLTIYLHATYTRQKYTALYRVLRMLRAIRGARSRRGEKNE